MTTSLHKKHRKIWYDNFGDIPVDENGISYEIHHINGNHNDNRIENLACVSITEHYEIHYNQGDTYACAAILRRMKNRLEYFENKQSNMEYNKESHPMYGKNHTEETKLKISQNHYDVSGKNNPMYGKTHTEETRLKISRNRKGKLKGVPKSEETRKKMSESIKTLTCPHCNKSARGNSMKRWHFDNCKFKKV
jgi:hypothetical protein